VSPLSHREYDALEAAVSRGSRIVISRRGRRDIVVVPLSLTLADGRIHLDGVERIEAVL
jgi:hypothetical protein